MNRLFLKIFGAVVAITLAPLAPADQWILAPGETPRSLAQLLYPAQPGTQRRFIEALAAANPGLAIDDSDTPKLAVGTSLQMPDWRLLNGASNGTRGVGGAGGAGGARDTAGALSPKPVTSVRERQEFSLVAVPVRPQAQGARESRLDRSEPTVALLRLETVLAPRKEAEAQLRQMLRLEYRLLTSFNEQLSSFHAAPLAGELPTELAPPAESPARMQAAVSLPVVPVEAGRSSPPVPLTLPPVVTPPPSTETALPPVKIPQAPPQAIPETDDALPAWIYYAGLGAVVLAVLLLLRRRRAVAPMPDFAVAETVVMERPPVSASEMEALFSAPEASPLHVVKAVSLPPPVDKGDPDPVMELAEIMLSFGRLQGAAQTLQEYIEANPKEALQPWFKLLDVYRVGDMRAEFDVLAEKLNRNFNVELQHWDAEAPAAAVAPDQEAKALSLEEMPHICEQVVARWGKPECIDYLHQLLRDNRGGQRSGFTLPVVQEILLLIDILVVQMASGSK
jgi:pilus assembly protein FimV